MQKEVEELKRQKVMENKDEEGMPEDEYVKVFKRLEETVNRANELDREVIKLKKINVSQKVLLDGAQWTGVGVAILAVKLKS